MVGAILLVISGLLVLLVRRHLSQLRAWDRPGWSRSAWFRPVALGVAWGALASGVALAFAASVPAGAAVGAVLIGMWAWTRWVRSSRHLAGHLGRELHRLRAERPGLEDRELLGAILLARHPRFGEELAAQMVAEHADVRGLAAILIRMERSSNEGLPSIRGPKRRGGRSP